MPFEKLEKSVEDLTPQRTGGNVVIIRNSDGSRSGHADMVREADLANKTSYPHQSTIGEWLVSNVSAHSTDLGLG